MFKVANTMSTFITLPAPVPCGSIVPGQLISDPFSSEATISCLPSSAHDQPVIYSKHASDIAHNETTKHPSKQFERKDSVMLSAEETTVISLSQPRTFFNSIQQDRDTRAFLQQHQTLYFVTAVQIIKNPQDSSAKRSVVDEATLAEASGEELRLPMHVRRPDSASNVNNTTEEHVLAVGLMKIKCRVGDKAAPHEMGDLEYDWSYHPLEGDLQLSIGLGSVLESTRLTKGTAIAVDEELTVDTWNYELSDDDDDSGLGGF